MLNRLTAIGNLTQDPQFKNVSNKYSVCKFSIAINNPVKKSVTFLDIETWNKTADNCSKYLRKGSSVAIDGKLDSSNWTDKSGNQRVKIFCVADTVHFLKTPSSNEKPEKPKGEHEELVGEVEDEDEVPF